jgi:hypothetical protein
MNVDQRSEDQETARKVEVEDVARDPRAGDEERNTACDQNCEVSEGTPVLMAFGAGFASGVVTGDPEILSGVHHRQHARAVAALRHAKAFSKREHCRKKKPYELRAEQCQRRNHAAPSGLTDETR